MIAQGTWEKPCLAFDWRSTPACPTKRGALTPTFLSDDDIAKLVSERKVLPPDWRQRIQVKPKRGHKEQELDLTGADGSEFRVILRQNNANPFDFSVILGHRVPKSNVVFRLRRYNGKHSEHSNPLESTTFYEYHIHQATERYQQSGLREDTYAEPTDRFADLRSAVRCLIEDCGFIEPAGTQMELV
jgi:hypothetical protein